MAITEDIGLPRTTREELQVEHTLCSDGKIEYILKGEENKVITDLILVYPGIWNQAYRIFLQGDNKGLNYTVVKDSKYAYVQVQIDIDTETSLFLIPSKPNDFADYIPECYVGFSSFEGERPLLLPKYTEIKDPLEKVFSSFQSRYNNVEKGIKDIIGSFLKDSVIKVERDRVRSLPTVYRYHCNIEEAFTVKYAVISCSWENVKSITYINGVLTFFMPHALLLYLNPKNIPVFYKGPSSPFFNSLLEVEFFEPPETSPVIYIHGEPKIEPDRPILTRIHKNSFASISKLEVCWRILNGIVPACLEIIGILVDSETKKPILRQEKEENVFEKVVIHCDHRGRITITNSNINHLLQHTSLLNDKIHCFSYVFQNYRIDSDDLGGVNSMETFLDFIEIKFKRVIPNTMLLLSMVGYNYSKRMQTYIKYCY